MSIKLKLVLFFIIVKIVPVLILFYIALVGANNLKEYLHDNNIKNFNSNSQILENTTKSALTDTIKYLDKKSQESLEKITYLIANNIANFLKERDKDLLFLSNIELNQTTIESFYKNKYLQTLKDREYIYNEKDGKWEDINLLKKDYRVSNISITKDNEKEFNFVDPYKYEYENRPIYKEINYFDLNGNEIYKVSQINKKLLNLKNKKNTYINSEDYFNEISNLKKGEIYVSDVIGEYVPSKVIGTFTKEKASKSGIAFEPEKYAYAGKENPVGKKFEGIIRFITPVFKDNKKVGYISLALDHLHLMAFTDNINPITPEMKQAISDASSGNYAFMWDYEGKNISHPRDYFIVGYDKNTGKRAMPWLSADIAKKYKESNLEINEFLEKYPTFEEQSLNKKPNIAQLKETGNLGLDCRYLNFAPQCEGWMQLTENGGYGSFIIFWSKVWKLTTAATIPYYTGKYKNSKRGFGFVTIGANVDEFHAAANETIERIENIVNNQKSVLAINLENNENIIIKYLKELTDELSVTTAIMISLVILIAFWMSSFISKKIENLLIGTKYFSRGEFDYKIEITSNDEIGTLEQSFNEMSEKIEKLLQEQKDTNRFLEKRVSEEVEKRSTQQKLLIQQSKLASMGEMIGNIAHQWRQPLNVLGLLIQTIQLKFQMNQLTAKDLDEIVLKSKNITNSMSETITDFMQFYNPNNENEIFNPKEAIDKVLKLLKSRDLNCEIIFNDERVDKELKINGSKNGLVQTLINLLTNAHESFINSSNKKDSQCIITVNLKDDNKKILIEVIDNGDGIEEKIIDRIFEPYFTTKFKSNGTGIGLYMSKMIIEENLKGTLNVKNNGTGATFYITIPYTNNL